MAEYENTDKLNLPYPTDDAMIDISGDIKKLAEAIDSAMMTRKVTNG